MSCFRPGERIAATLVLGLLALLVPATARAQITGRAPTGKARAHAFDGPAAARSDATPRQLEGVGLDEHLGERIPKNLVFRNEQGRKVKLGDFFDGERPVILTLNYHDCKMLCGIQLRGFAGTTLRGMNWAPGGNYEVVTVDFNPREGPADAHRAKKKYLQMLGKEGAGAGWHFLTMTEGRRGKQAIQSLTRAVGFKYHWVENAQQFAHPAAYIFISGEGKITRYLSGLEPKPRDARLALIEAGNGTVGSLVEQIYLSCCKFDPAAGSYVASAWQFTKITCYFLAALLAGFLAFMWWLEKRPREGWAEEQLAGREA